MFPSLDPRITESILRVVQDRRIVGILGMGGLLWTSTWVFGSLRSAFHIIFRVKRDRSLLRRKAVDLFMLFLAGTLLLMREQRIERACYEVDFARRPYDAVDPDNRLVARDLERRFEEALRSLERTEAEAQARPGEMEEALSKPNGNC
jgi:hypothetical protein